MHRILLFVLILSPIFTFCQKPGRVHIVPEPVSVASKTGSFLLNATTKIIFPAGNSEMQLAADYLAGMLSTSTGYKLVPIASNAKTNKVVYPYHYRDQSGTTGSAATFKQWLGTDLGIEVRLRKWY